MREGGGGAPKGVPLIKLVYFKGDSTEPLYTALSCSAKPMVNKTATLALQN